MKHLLLSAILLAAAASASAVPAKRGQWQTIQLANGGTARVQLAGDEYMHWLQAEDGSRYQLDENTGLYSLISAEHSEKLASRAAARRSVVQTGAKRAARIGHPNDKSVFQGTKKGIVILIDYPNRKFQDVNDINLYKEMVNGVGYKSDKAIGSVRDYFRAQSAGQFDIDFDVVGPYTMENNYSYYGKNDAYGNDKHPGEMIVEACMAAHEDGIDFSQYDWDGDGEVDQVFVLYAGKGEADGGSTSTIWPHMYYLKQSDYGKALKLDGVKVNTYACSCELNGTNSNNGIGTFCHEFSHCMGFADLYDTGYGGWFGMSQYDLMDMGSYNGDGWIPTGYSAFEKNECGWITLHDMTFITETENVEGLKPISEHGDAYIIKNKMNDDEAYIVEYRKKTGWDMELPDEGVMITHLDYDPDIWDYNVPNSNNGTYVQNGKYKTNDHQRLTIFHANNREILNDALYPYIKTNSRNDSLCATSKPAAKLYNTNADGTNFMHVEIKKIAISEDKATASMSFIPVKSDSPGLNDVLYTESFNLCNGKGGNDGLWSDFSGATAPKYEDGHKAWTSPNTKIYAGSECLRLGTSSFRGIATSPSFLMNGSATLTFKAGAWNDDADGTLLNLSATNATISDKSVTMTRGEWTEFTTTLTGKGSVSITFESEKGRFFLDEVKIMATPATGISLESANNSDKTICGYYTLNGMKLSTPQKGINIVRYADGTTRKIVVM